MRSPDTAPKDFEQPWLLIVLGALGILGTVVLIVAVVVAAAMVPDHGWMAETISDLAAGRLEIITDVALYGFAAALIATAMAATHAHPGGGFWSAGAVALAVLAGLVVTIGARNEYGDGDSEGIVVHRELVYALGALFLLAMLAMAKGAGEHHPRLRPAFFAMAALWGGLAPGFFLVPTSIDGAYERGLGLIAAAFVICLSWAFLRRGLAGLGRGR